MSSRRWKKTESDEEDELLGSNSPKKARSRRAPQKQKVTSGRLRHEEDSHDNYVDLLNSLKKTRRGQAAQQELFNSLKKSLGSVVSSENDSSDGEVVMIANVKHKNLLDPPPEYNMGSRLKAIDEDKLGEMMRIPDCCTKAVKASKAHRACFNAIRDGDLTIIHLQGLASKTNSQMMHQRKTLGNK